YRRRHLDYFVRFAESAEPKLKGPEQKAWLERVHYERYNISVALDFSVESAETIGAGLRLAGAVERFCEVRGYFTEGYEHLTALLARAGAGGATVEPEVIAKAQLSAGMLSWCQDRDADSLRHYRAAQPIYEKLGRREAVGQIEALLGFTQRNDGHPEE